MPMLPPSLGRRKQTLSVTILQVSFSKQAMFLSNSWQKCHIFDTFSSGDGHCPCTRLKPSVFHGVGLWDVTLWRWTFCIDIEDFAWEDGHDTYAYVSCPHLLTDVVSSSWPSAPLFISQAWSLSCETLWEDPNPYMANSAGWTHNLGLAMQPL